MDLNLDTIIKSLNGRFDELRGYSFVEPDPVEENRKWAKLHALMTDLNEEIIKWERIRHETNASVITITPVSAEDQTALNRALQDLNVAIQQDEVWHRVIGIATTALEAAAKLRSATSATAQAGALPKAMLTALANTRVETLLARHSPNLLKRRGTRKGPTSLPRKR